MARHQDLTANHILESWVYPTAVERIAATGFTDRDVGRIGYQYDDGTYWRLLSTAPTWAHLLGAPTGDKAMLQTAAITTAGTASGSYVMAGLGGLIIPLTTGKLVITAAGSLYNTGTGGAQCVLRWAAGTSAPAHGAASVGGGLGGIAARNTGWGANQTTPFSLTAISAGFIVGTSYWLDLAYFAAPPGNAIIFQAAISAYEI